jgi:hypothetical protein
MPTMAETPVGPNQPLHLTPTDLEIISMKDEDYVPLTWPRIKEIIAIGDLELLTRQPSQLRLYRDWMAETKKEYGTVTQFILKKRVCWEPLPCEKEGDTPRFAIQDPMPFKARSDYRILLNDWPYGWESGIKHICVWLKTPLPVDDDMGALLEEGRVVVDAWVQENITRALGVEGQDRIIWFKNDTARQSVRAMEHIHILLRDVDGVNLDAILEKPWLD